jgi:purine nucleoside permease
MADRIHAFFGEVFFPFSRKGRRSLRPPLKMYERRNHLMEKVFRALAFLLIALLTPALAQAAPAKAPVEVRVVIVTTWETYKDGKDQGGELHAWLTRWPLATSLPFPVGDHALRYDPKRHVLAILTGMATARAAASIMALGTDPRFDLRHAYWIVAGTAGVDPLRASVGSAAWARWIVDGDLAQEIDPRDAPTSWPIGIVPYDRTTPYQTPAPPGQMADGNIVYALNRKLVDWAYARTKDITLPDSAILAGMRAPYAGPGAAKPFVLEGDALMSARFWYGEHLNDWARRWTPYWTNGAGVFVMSAEEDTGILQALTFLAQDHRVRLDRVLILRAASDYTLAPPGMSAADFMVKESNDNFPGTPAALDSLYRVAAPVAHALADDWVHTRETTPGG